MMPSIRHLLPRAVWALTLAAATAQAGTQAQAVDTSNSAGASAASKLPATSSSKRMQHSRANAFAGHSWLPPVVKAKAPPPPPPRAPPLPFAYLGRMQDGAAITAFVSQGERNHVLRSGDTLPAYRVESITPAGITFVYLPLGETQRLTFGNAN